MKIPLEDRFWSKVNFLGKNGCWLWKAAVVGPYGIINIDKTNIYSHRKAYELVLGKIPVGYEVDHLCKNPRCVNPAHLEPVTPQENLRRSNSVSTLNARKTHCPRGHPLVEPNLSKAHLKFGKRLCLICEIARVKRRPSNKEYARMYYRRPGVKEHKNELRRQRKLLVKVRSEQETNS